MNVVGPLSGAETAFGSRQAVTAAATVVSLTCRQRHSDVTLPTKTNHSCTIHDPSEHDVSRRSLLSVATMLPAVVVTTTGNAPAQAAQLQQDTRVQPLQAFWQQLVHHLQQQLSDSFAPNLVFYGPGEVLPSGTPGDPAAEYNKRSARTCGAFSSGFKQPYAVCPDLPGDTPSNDTARDCCRHFAFAVPRSRYAFAALDRQTSVVVSPRLALAAPDTWQGVLVHEMGHCIDFFTFPQRYQLPGEPAPASAAAAAALASIDARESDAELRADLMADALLRPLLGRQLCYDSSSTVQRLVPLSTECLAADPKGVPVQSTAAPLYLQHFPHPPVLS